MGGSSSSPAGVVHEQTPTLDDLIKTLPKMMRVRCATVHVIVIVTELSAFRWRTTCTA
jgi:hypothetical protein